MLVAPERRISSELITKMAAAVRESFSSFFDTEVTLISIKTSRLACPRSIGFGAGFCAPRSGINPKTTARPSDARFTARSLFP